MIHEKLAKNKPRIIGICGSPRQGNTEWMVKRVLSGAAQEGATVKLFLLRKKHIEMCDGCLACEKTGKCHLRDDFNQLYKEIGSCDGIVLGTPVRFDSITPEAKNAIDRLNPLCDKLRNKKLAVTVVGQLNGVKGSRSRRRAISYLRNVARILEMEFVGSVEGTARAPGEISALEYVGRDCNELGRKIVTG